jgi:3-oxoacyl-[acyl-carrier-protein] synthase II
MTYQPVFVTGIGAVTPYGVGSDLFWQSLINGIVAAKPIENFNANVYRSHIGAEVPQSVYQNQQLRFQLGNPIEDATYFAAIATHEALKKANLNFPFKNSDRVGCVIGTLCSGVRNLMNIMEQHHIGEQNYGTQYSIESTLASYQLNFLTKQFNLTGPSALVSTACSSSTDAIGYATDLIRYGECDMALAGGGDVLAELVHGGFNSVFSITQNQARPFDKKRDGFFIGEGAGMILLESHDSANRRGATIYAEVLGYGLSNAAYHLTATSEDGLGESLSIQRALDDAKLLPNQIDYINAHGTATLHNDNTEIRSIRSVFKEHTKNLYVNSIKPMIGHCMGAAGILEAISTIFSLQTNIIPPTLNTFGDEDEVSFQLVKDRAVTHSLKYALSESFGFGGACSCICLGKYEY